MTAVEISDRSFVDIGELDDKKVQNGLLQRLHRVWRIFKAFTYL